MKEKKNRGSFDLDVFLTTADEGRTIARYRRNHVVFRQGDPADAVFYVQEGKFEVTVVSDQGKEAVVSVHPKGDFFGTICLTGQPLRLGSVRAMTESITTRIDKTLVLRALHDEPAFAERFTTYLLQRNAQLEEGLIDQFFNSSEKRLAKLLLRLASFEQYGTPPVVEGISQQTLANMVGTTRSRVCHFMNKFREMGFIEYTGRRLKVHKSLSTVLRRD